MTEEVVMAYSVDLREKAISLVEKGKSKYEVDTQGLPHEIYATVIGVDITLLTINDLLHCDAE